MKLLSSFSTFLLLISFAATNAADRGGRGGRADRDRYDMRKHTDRRNEQIKSMMYGAKEKLRQHEAGEVILNERVSKNGF